MASESALSSSSTLSSWIEQLHNQIFTQPDNGIITCAYKQLVAPFTARINQDQFTRQKYSMQVSLPRTQRRQDFCRDDTMCIVIEF
ncbi:hypothetical protein BDZ85DRAFT_263460 [Elsinoe ampelina]|uniref:Uncharacterized protein n=1 Tax=Elsinoe ampelina TaxID=302913 RepID=A0A6A6G9C6_9PEZI|nr:hypothetical protein BDZ85DRAFT_263460 [Elsinoe ampelina]